MLRAATALFHRAPLYSATAVATSSAIAFSAAASFHSPSSAAGCDDTANSAVRTHAVALPWPVVLPTLPSSDLIRPAVEAASRALNLVMTVVLIVVEYEHEKADRWAVARGWKVVDGHRAEILTLKDDVRRRKARLERAQGEYTGYGTSDVADEQLAEEHGLPQSDATDVVSRGKERRGGRTEGRDGSRQPQSKKREAVWRAASLLAEADERLLEAEERIRCSSPSGGESAHRRAAACLLRLCRANGGVYIKVGQHLANLDYLIPPEYTEALSSLFDDAPLTDYGDVREVVREDLGAYPEDIFDSFERQPIASASLAQVHVARERGTGRKLAVKVQHRGLRETSRGDILALTAAVRVIERIFPDDFELGWLVDEIAPNLPRELDFVNEGRNSETAARHISEVGLSNAVVVPAVHWDKTAARVLTMDFEEGVKATDLETLRSLGLQTGDVARLIASTFHAQVFRSGFVHCDPHPANVLVRSDGRGKPRMVLVDHGLYKRLDDRFRVQYSRLWKALTIADMEGIKDSCADLGIDEMYPLLAAMLTSRPFDEIIERSKSGSLAVGKSSNQNADQAMIRGYAQRFLADIIKMLDAVPRQMLLLFKMNDCLRHIDGTLGACHADGLAIAGRYAARTVYEAELRDGCGGGSGDTSGGSSNGGGRTWLGRFRSLLAYCNVLFRIQIHELHAWWIRSAQPSLKLSN